MRNSIYIKLAWRGIKTNKKIYIPYIIAGIGMVIMCYIMNFLALTRSIENFMGIDMIREIFTYGSIIVAIFAAIFLFYTNSFIMKNRKKEFGLYNVLGMNKINIGMVLFWENLFIGMIAIVVGICGGILLSKLSELFLLNLIKAPIDYTFKVPKGAILNLLKVYVLIFLAIFLNDLRQIKCANTISLLNSKNEGEKPLKGNWIVGILGVVLLGIGYYLAVIIKDPYTAILIFFLAVILVILGTYLLMIFGSVLLCKCLQKNKKYYYNKKHFVAVSSMAYRMKRNGASLASICILLTMILVTISTTGSLYFGVEEILNNRIKDDFKIEYRLNSGEELLDNNIEKLQKNIKLSVEKQGNNIVNSKNIRSIQFAGTLTDGKISVKDGENVKLIQVTSIDDFNKFMGSNETVLDEQVIVININDNDFADKTIKVGNNKPYQVKKILGEDKNPLVTQLTIKGVVIIVPDIISFYDQLVKNVGKDIDLLQYKYISNFNIDGSKADNIKLGNYFNSAQFHNPENNLINGKYASKYVESRANISSELYGLYGGFLGLGVMVSIMFTIGAVMIIYYKQLNEGYEDRASFVLMQKIGMTKDEIKKNINSQLVIVFLLPVIFAGLHLLFAFPMLKLILNLMWLYNENVFFIASVVAFVICAIVYMVVYKITSKGYLNIVGEMNNRQENI